MYKAQWYEKEISVKEYLRDYVNVAEFLEYCKECPNYDRLWSCPPYDFDPEDYWKEYHTLYLLACKINFEEGTDENESMKIMLEVKNNMAEKLFAMEESCPGSVSLSAGSCGICQSCTRPEGKPCTYKDKMRYSIESLGGDVGRTLSRLMGIRLEWMQEGKVPSYFVLCGGLLKKL